MKTPKIFRLFAIFSFLFLVFTSGFLVSVAVTKLSNKLENRRRSHPEAVMVKRVVDGDIIELSDDRKVRYIGIDTPETVDPRRAVQCFGREASAKNKELVEGKEIVLERDVSETDKYGRLLRYVYLATEGGRLFVNEYLAREGYALAATFPPNVKFADQFVSAEKTARAEKRGLWKKCGK